MTVVITLSSRDYDAVLFDLDGVLTKTARVHASGLEKVVSTIFSRERAARVRRSLRTLLISTTTTRDYVDGKSRLRRRGISSSRHAGSNCRWGRQEDGPDVQSMHALGNLKDRYFMKHLAQHGVDSYEASITSGAPTPGATDQDRRRVL